MAWHGLRTLFGRFDEVLVGVASRASQVIEWDRTHQYCGRCGSPTAVRSDERARACPSCRLTVYPRINPAIMVLITNGRQILLARRPSAPNNRFSALAGFVEAGEALEQTVAREVREEVGVEVKNIRYFGSQSWPFPNSLMIAFVADYAGGEIRPDGVEIEEARWFDPVELPNVPDRISISRWLIDSVCAELQRER
jgi:NAD+ diphosphatase